jgi:hypothetical protein
MTTTTSSQIKNFSQKVSQILFPIEGLNVQSTKIILSRYKYVFEGNFITWMTSSYLFAQSLEAKQNSFENIWVEVIQNHPGLLHEFARAASINIDTDQIDESISKIREQISQQKSVYSITLMALLESSSAIFVPYLENLAISLGVKDLKYSQIHGIADIKHADQFLESLNAENAYYDDEKFDTQVNLAFENAFELLESIFVLQEVFYDS